MLALAYKEGIGEKGMLSSRKVLKGVYDRVGDGKEQKRRGMKVACIYISRVQAALQNCYV